MVRAVMVQGTGSDVGKSLMVAGVARALARRGLKVRPFKPQNMSNNAAVTVDGGEIGRAQALQARACGVPPSVHMNPVLLKPQSETGSQIIVQGRVAGVAKAREYQAWKPRLLASVLDSFRRLAEEADLVIVEGAGSAAEVNLRRGDIANMGFAEAAGVPVVLIGDIDRGGVVAQIVGSAEVIEAADRARLKGFVINKMRGDGSLFDEGVAFIEARTGLPCLGVVPWLSEAASLPAEDVLGLSGGRTDGPIRIAVPVLPRIANFDDLDPLKAEPDVALRLIRAGEAIPGNADLVILPGSKATLADLAAFRAAGFDIDLKAHHRRGGHVLGLCGGYQMLGRSIADPEGLEGAPGKVDGLGLLAIDTVLGADKRLVETAGTERASGAVVKGYEIHLGTSSGPDAERPMLDLQGGPDGAVSSDGRVMGTYLHGLFASDGFRHAFLDRLRRRETSGLAWEAHVEAALDRLADHLEAHLDLDRLLSIAETPALLLPEHAP